MPTVCLYFCLCFVVIFFQKSKKKMLKRKRFFKTETKIYLAIWISAVGYAIFHFTNTSQKYIQNFYDSYDDFSPGWYILNYRQIDKADFEWETIGYFIGKMYPFILFYLVVSELLRCLQFDTKLQQYFQTIFPLLYITQNLGYRIALLFFSQPLLFTLANKFRSKTVIWTCNLASLALIALYKRLNLNEQFLKNLQLNHFDAYITILVLCWLNLRCTSYYLNTTSKKDFIGFLSYCFYFPTIVTGPFIPYDEFKKMYNVGDFEGLDKRIKKLGWNMFRCIFWFVFVNFGLHYVYVNATSFQMELVHNLDFSSLCGYGYLMGQFFHIKYIVLYGLSTSLASFENITVPSLPRCIGRVHLYSDMWKFFDPGLYTFLKTYIYLPSQTIIGTNNKLLPSFLCFFFVYIWHGTEEYILIWASLNYLGVTIESVANAVYEKRLRSVEFVRNLGEGNLRRIKCGLAAPLLAMSSVSNFYFFAGREVGDVFVRRAFSGVLLSTIQKLNYSGIKKYEDAKTRRSLAVSLSCSSC